MQKEINDCNANVIFLSLSKVEHYTTMLSLFDNHLLPQSMKKLLQVYSPFVIRFLNNTK